MRYRSNEVRSESGMSQDSVHPDCKSDVRVERKAREDWHSLSLSEREASEEASCSFYYSRWCYTSESLRIFSVQDSHQSRLVIKNPVKDETKTWYLTKKQEEDPKYFKDQESGLDLEIVESEPLGDWLMVKYGDFGVKVELISDKTQEGF